MNRITYEQHVIETESVMITMAVVGAGAAAPTIPTIQEYILKATARAGVGSYTLTLHARYQFPGLTGLVGCPILGPNNKRCIVTAVDPKNGTVTVQIYTAGVAAVAAHATFTADTNANMADADIVTLNDGERSVTYEYDKSANGVVAGRVNWAAGAGSAATVAATLKTAILANQPRLGVVDNLDGTLTITNLVPGADGNTVNAKTSASALAITNFTGGVDAVADAASDLTAAETLYITNRYRNSGVKYGESAA